MLPLVGCRLAGRDHRSRICQGIVPTGSPCVVVACEREVEPSPREAAISAEIERERE